MYRPSMRSRRTLTALMVLAAGLFYWAENSRVLVKQEYYDLKLQAAKKMARALSVIRENRAAVGWALDEVNDPDQSALIGPHYSLITTSQGDLGAKLTTINPNFAAVVLQMLENAGVKSGDKAAVAFTGSFPALNIAVICACEVLNVEPVIITSVGSSMWGANNPEFTYLDMEKVLFDAGVIKHRSVAASIGGGDDIGRSISKAGCAAILEAMKRTGVMPLEAHSLKEAQAKHRAVYEEKSGGTPYRVFINVGGGVAVLGHPENGQLIPPGLNKIYLQLNYPALGIIHEYWEKGTPIIHLLNVNVIAQRYGLPISPVPLPPIGSGEIFAIERYNLNVAWISVIILFTALITVLLLDRDKYKLRREGVDPDTLL